MAKVNLGKVKVTKVSEIQSVGKNNTSLVKLTLIEDIRKKIDGQWKTVGKNVYDDIEVWGNKAMDAAGLKEGTIIDLSPEIMNGDKGQWVKYRANLSQNSWEYKGKNYSKLVISLLDWEEAYND